MGDSDDSTAVVLAGGQGSRFDGGEKALATVGGQPLIVRAVAAVRRAVDGCPIVAVATPEQRDTFESLVDEASVQFIRDAPDRAGPLAGLASAADTATANWLLVVGCDMPFVDVRAIAWLGARRGPDVDAVVPADDGGIHPLHAWYRRDAVSAALSSLSPEASLRALLDELAVDTVTSEQVPADVDLARSVQNVNTVADLATARRTYLE